MWVIGGGLLTISDDMTLVATDGMTLAAAIGAVADRYATERQSEREAAERRRLDAASILEHVITVTTGIDPWQTMTCSLCQASLAGVVHRQHFWVTRVPHLDGCPAATLAWMASEEPPR